MNHRVVRSWRPVLALGLGSLAAACGGSGGQAAGDGGAPDADAASPEADGAPPDGAADAAPPADWAIAIDPSKPAGKVGPALLGHYDLSGALFHYDQNAGLVSAMKAIGFSDWRVGVGRWEVATQILPTLTDPSQSCASQLAKLPAAARATAATDLDLIAARDWFTDDGAPVTVDQTLLDSRYALAYVRSVLDVAAVYGVTPYVDVDSMPRALAANRTPFRGGALPGQDPCLLTFTNKVSNVAPADPDVYASAVVGLVKRIVEGSGAEAPRVAPNWEIWNEPELAYAWDPSFEASPGKLDRFFRMALGTLVKLDAYRAQATAGGPAKALRFGLGSFAYAQTAVTTLGALDATPLPGGAQTPVDFVSFHSYANDPLKIVADMRAVVAARDASAHYKNAELVLSEWGPDLGAPSPDTTMERALHHATVIAVGANLGIARAHQSIFYDFYPGLGLGILDHGGQPKPAYHAYALMTRVLVDGAARLPLSGHEDGELDLGMGAVLAARDPAGKVRLLVVNRGGASRSLRVDLAGAATPPARITVLDDPARPPRDVAPSGPIVVVPPLSVAVVEF